jgi:IS5 family transposase
MKQADLGLNLVTKRTRKREFLLEMDFVVPWSQLVALITPHAPPGHTGRPPFPVETMLRIHFLQQWFALSDPAMEEALFDMPLFREFALIETNARLPDETTILRFRHLLEKHALSVQIFATVNAVLAERGLLLKQGTVVDATLIAAPSSTKNAQGERDPEMRQTKKGNQWHFGMKAHIGVDADSGLVHTVKATAANEADVVHANSLLHGEETEAHGDSGFQGAHKRDDADPTVKWHIAMRPGQRRRLDRSDPKQALIAELERVKAAIRAKVEHPFRVLKRQFGHVKVRYRGLAKNRAQLLTLFALVNLWMVRRRLMPATGEVRA